MTNDSKGVNMEEHDVVKLPVRVEYRWDVEERWIVIAPPQIEDGAEHVVCRSYHEADARTIADALNATQALQAVVDAAPSRQRRSPMTDEEMGQHANALLDDPAFKEAVTRLERDIIEAWRASPSDQAEMREWLYLRLSALGAVREELRLIMARGEIAERERLRQEHEAADRQVIKEKSNG